MTYIDFAQLKQDVSIEQVLSMLEVDLKKSGNQLRGTCPIHDGENDRQFVVTPSKGVFYCFGDCEAGGDIIELVSRVRQISHKEAAQAIAEQFGISAPKSQEKPQEGFKPLSYLQNDHKDVLAMGVSCETLQHFGAGYAPKGIHRGKLAIPIFAEEGELLAYVGVDLKDKSLHYPKDYEPDMFNIQNIQEGTLYITRNPLAVLTAYENGIENCIALLADIRPETLEAIMVLMATNGCEICEVF